MTSPYFSGSANAYKGLGSGALGHLLNGDPHFARAHVMQLSPEELALVKVATTDLLALIETAEQDGGDDDRDR